MKNYEKYPFLLIPLFFASLAIIASRKKRIMPPFEGKQEPFGVPLPSLPRSEMLCAAHKMGHHKLHPLLWKAASIFLLFSLGSMMKKMRKDKEGGKMERIMRFCGKKADEVISKMEKEYASR